MGKAAGAILAIGAIALGGWIAGPAILGFAAESIGFLVARTVIAMGVMSIGSSLFGLNKSDKAGAEGSKSSGILANEASGVASIPIVYGRRRVGARRVYMNVSDSNQKLHIVMAVAEGEIGRFRKVYFNEELAIDLTGGGTDPKDSTTMPLQAFTSGANSAGEVISATDSSSGERICSKYRDYVRFEYRLGTETQTAFSYLTGKFAEWASTAQGKGLALVYFEFTFNRDVFSSVPSITVEIDGRKIATAENLSVTDAVDFSHANTSTSSNTIGLGSKTFVLATDDDYRSGQLVNFTYNSTNYMGGTVTSYTSATKTLVVNITYLLGSGTRTSWTLQDRQSYGARPGDVVYDYLTNETYGKGINPANIDIQSFIDVNTYCGESIALNFNGDIQPLGRYWINGHLVPDDTLYDNLKKLLSAFNGYLVYSNGRYYLKVNRERTGDETTNSNLFLFDEGNIIGKYDVSLGTKATRFNQVKLVHFDRNQSYQSNIIYYANSTYLTQDNDTVIERDMDLALVTDPRQATYLAALALNQSRFSMAISFTASFAALQVEVGDIVRVTTGNLGFDEKLFRILSIGLNVDGTVKLDGVEYDDTLYTPGTLPEIPLVGTVTAETGSSLYTPVMAPPTNVVATASKSTQTDGTILAAIDVSWDAVSGAVSYEITQTGTSSAIYVTTGNTYKIENLPNGTYNVGVASVNSYGSKSVKAY